MLTVNQHVRVILWSALVKAALSEGSLVTPPRRSYAIIIIIIIIITTTMFMVLSSRQSHCESSPGSTDECRTGPSGRRPKTKPDYLGCESVCAGCQSLHPPSPFIIITQPESCYSFYRPTEGRRLSRPSWLVKYRDGFCPTALRALYDESTTGIFLTRGSLGRN